MNAPAASTARPKVPANLFGMVLFISSEVMFFGALFACLFALREANPGESAELEPLLPLALTVVLLASSVTAHLAARATHRGELGRAQRLLTASIALGLGFLGGQALEYSGLGWSIGDSTFTTTFFTITGFHGLHVAIGVAILALARAQVRRGYASQTRPGDVEAAVFYWHFVDAIWLAVLGGVYLLA